MYRKKSLRFAAIFSALCITLSAGITNAAAATTENGALSQNDEHTVETEQPTYDENTEDSLPPSYSSVPKNFVTEIKSQSYNDCGFYAAIATFESKLLSSGLNIGNMSEKHLNVWATTHSDGKGWQRNYKSDGFTNIALGYFTSWYGGAEEAEVGDISLNETTSDMITPDFTKYGTTSVKYLSKNRPDEIKQSIIDNGGVSTAYAHNTSFESYDRTSYFMPSSYNGSYTGHAIEVVGWDDNYSKENFGTAYTERPANDGAWLVKNSWGDYNVLGGYFWISYEDKYIFDNKYKPSYTIMEYEEITENKKLYQNEIYGATYEFDYLKSFENVSYINKFDFSEDFNNLDKVVFETTSTGADYTIYYIPTDEETGELIQDKAEWQELYSDIVPFSGYICADIEDYKLPTGMGGLAVTIDTSSANEKFLTEESEYVENSFGVGEWITNTSGVFSFINDSKYGDCYVMYDDEMLDLLDWYKIYNNDDLGGTFVIKAITTKEKDTPKLLGDANLDGIIDITDVTLIQKNIVMLETLSEESQINADYNQDGRIDINDATEIQKMLVGLI